MIGLLKVFSVIFALLPLSSSVWGASQHSEAGATTLAVALNAMMERHPTLLSKQAQVESKGFLLESAKAERFPSVSLSYGEGEDSEQEGAFVVKQPLWAFGRIDTGIQYAKTDVSAETLDQLRVTRNLLEETAVAYLKVLGVQQQLVILEENIQQHQRFLEQIERRKEGRLASQTDTLIAASRLTQTKAQEIQMRGDLRDALMVLQTLTQLPIQSVASMDVTHLLVDAQSPEIRQQVLQQSAEVQYKEQLVDLAVQDVYRKRSNFMPTLYLKFSHEYSDSATYPDESRFSLVMEGSLEGLGLITRYQEKSSFSQLYAAEREVEVTQFDLENRLNSLLQNLATQKSLINSHQDSIDQLSATLDSYLRQYKSGRKEWIDVLNMQREITEQRLSQSQARNNVQINTIELVALLGGLDPLLNMPLTTKP